MHRSGDIKTSMMSGIDRRIRRPNFLNNLRAPPCMTNTFGKQDFQQKHKSLPGISHDYNEFDEEETHDTTQVNFGYQEYAEANASLYNTPGSLSNNGSSNGFPVQHVPKSTNRSVGENAKLGYNTVINDIGVSGDSRPGFRYQTNVQKRAKNVMENIIANTACVDRTFISGTVRDLSLYGKQSVIQGIPQKSQNQEENRNGTLNRNHTSCAVPTNQSMISGVNSETNATHTLYGEQPVTPGITRHTQNQDLNCGMIKRVQSSYALPTNPEFDEDDTHDTTQVNFGYQEYAEGDASLYNTPGSRSNNGSCNGFPVQHVPKSTNRSVGENAKLGYNTVKNDIGVSGDSRPGFRYQTNVQKRAKNVMENIIANTACVDRTFISGTVRDLSLYGKQSVIPGIPKKSQNQEENRNGTLNRNHTSCAIPPNQSMNSGVNSETDAKHTLYGEQPVTPGITRHTQNQDINRGMIKRVQSSYALPTNPDLLLEMQTNTTETPSEMEAIGVSKTYSLYGKQSVLPGISKISQNQDNLNHAMIKRVQCSYALSPNNDMLFERKTDALQTQSELEAKRIVDTHSLYGEQSVLPGITKNNTNGENRCDEVIINAKSSYKLEPNPDTKLETHTNGDDVNTEYADKYGSDIERSNACQSLDRENEASTMPCFQSLNSSQCDQGHINLAEERLAEMLNEEDNDKCYSEHVSVGSNNTISYERREVISTNVAYSSETSQSEKNTSAESDTNVVKEINNAIVPLAKTDDTLNHQSETTAVEKNVPDSYKELSLSEASSKKICNYESNQVDLSEGTYFIAIPQYSKEIVSSDKERYTKNENTSDAEISLNKDSKILIGHKNQKEENINESGPTEDTANDEASNLFHKREQRVELDDSSGDNTTQEKSPSKEASIIRATVIVANPESVKRKHRKRRADREKKTCSSDDKNAFKEDSTNMSTESTSVNMKHENSSDETSFTTESSDTDDDIDKVPDDILDDDTNNTLDNLTNKKCKGNGSAETVIRTENEARLNHEKIHKELLYKSKSDVKDNIDKSTQTFPKFFENRIDHALVSGNDVNVPDAMCLICKEQAAFKPLKVRKNEQTIKSKYMAKRKKHNNDNKLEYKLAQNSKFNVATSKPTRSDVYMRIMNILETKIGPERAPDLMRSSTISDMLKNMDKNPMKYGFNYANFQDENIYMDINKLICDPTIIHADSATHPCFKQEQPRMSLSNDNKQTLTVPESDRGCKDFCYSTYVGMEHDRNTRDMKDNNNMSDTSREVKANIDGGICCMDEDFTSECKIMKNCSSIKCKDNDQIPKTKQKKSSKIKAFFRSLMCFRKPKTNNEYINT